MFIFSCLLNMLCFNFLNFFLGEGCNFFNIIFLNFKWHECANKLFICFILSPMHSFLKTYTRFIKYMNGLLALF